MQRFVIRLQMEIIMHRYRGGKYMDKVTRAYSAIHQQLTLFCRKIRAAQQEIDQKKLDWEERISKEANRKSIQLEKMKEKQNNVNTYLEIAKASANRLIAPTHEQPYNEKALIELQVQIPSNLRCAETLYTCASAQMLYLENQKRRISSSSAANVVAVPDTRVLQKKKQMAEQELVQYVYGEDFSRYVCGITAIRQMFNVPWKKYPPMDGYIAYGEALFPLEVPKDLLNKVQERYKDGGAIVGERITMPLLLSVKGGSLCISYQNEQQIARMLQGVILNIARYYARQFEQILFLDPMRGNVSLLEELTQICGYSGKFIETVSATANQISKRLQQIAAVLANCAVSGTERTARSRLLVFHNYPQEYDAQSIKWIRQLCVNAKQNGTLMILTHNSAWDGHYSSDHFEFIQRNSQTIVCENGNYFRVSTMGKRLAQIRLYCANGKLPLEIKTKLEKRRSDRDMSNLYAKRIGYEPTFFDREKGNRKLLNLPYGVDAQGNLVKLDFENKNFACFLAAAPGAGKTELLHVLLTDIIRTYHPDDVEIWLIDFKMTEFSRYLDCVPPHVRYIILDQSPELVYDIVDRLYEVKERRIQYLQDRSPTQYDYFPALFVIIDEFSIMANVLSDVNAAGMGSEAKLKLEEVLSLGRKLGMHFIFSSQSFTSGSKGLTTHAKDNCVRQRITMMGPKAEIQQTMEINACSDRDAKLINKLIDCPQYVMTRGAEDASGNRLKVAHGLYINKPEEQLQMIRKLKDRILPVKKYNPTNLNCYRDKEVLLKNGKGFVTFVSQNLRMKKQTESTPAILIYPGEPRRLCQLFPIKMFNEGGQNLLMIASQDESAAAASVVTSVIRSLNFRTDETVQVWVGKEKCVWTEIKSTKGMKGSTLGDTAGICSRVREIQEKITAGESGSLFVIIPDAGPLLRQIEKDLNSKVKDSAKAPSSGSYFSRSGPSMAELMAGAAPVNIETSARVEVEPLPDYAKFLEQLAFLLEKGADYGYHFMLCFSTHMDFAATKLRVDWLQHRILFRMDKATVRNYGGMVSAVYTETLEKNSFRYINNLDDTTFKVYLHEGISLDGWTVENGRIVRNIPNNDSELM